MILTKYYFQISKIFDLFFLSPLPPTRFQCIQACDYDETTLVTAENLVRHRKKKFAHLSLKHITLLGIVRVKQKRKNLEKEKTSMQNSQRQSR